MRNGNFGVEEYIKKFYVGSYRTYEEWKPSFYAKDNHKYLRSYRTYEEWKPPCTHIHNHPLLCSYRTYEEWKHREGNEFQITDWVLTVPMRNGNSVWSNTVVNTIVFLPYL